MTLREAIASGAARLSEHSDLRDHAARDAELLLLHATGAARTSIFTDGNRIVDPQKLLAYHALISRRLAGEPIQYIVGEQEFYGLPFMVTPAALIPRPETEVLVEAALRELTPSANEDRELRIADVGTGSGAIAIAIARHLPQAQVTALDLSESALAVAEENARRHGVEGQIEFVLSDLLQAIGGHANYDAVLSNPPYVPDSDRNSLHRQVRDFEPKMALFAGADGLDIYRRLVPEAARLLRPGGLLGLEIGYGQRAALESLLRDWNHVEVLDDLQGIARVVLARKPE